MSDATGNSETGNIVTERSPTGNSETGNIVTERSPKFGTQIFQMKLLCLEMILEAFFRKLLPIWEVVH